MNFNERSHQHQHCDEGRHELPVRRYVDAGIVAQILGVSRDSVYRRAREGSTDGAYRFNRRDFGQRLAGNGLQKKKSSSWYLGVDGMFSEVGETEMEPSKVGSAPEQEGGRRCPTT